MIVSEWALRYKTYAIWIGEKEEIDIIGMTVS